MAAGTCRAAAACSRAAALWTLTVLFAALMACESPSDNGKAKPTDRPAAQKAPAAQSKPPAPASEKPAPAPAKPEPKAPAKKGAAKHEEQPAENAPTAVKSEQRGMAQSAHGDPPDATPAAAKTETRGDSKAVASDPPQNKPMTEEDRKALIEQIRNQAAAAKKDPMLAPKPPVKEASPRAPAEQTPAAHGDAPTAAAASTAAAEPKKEGGCGAAQGPQLSLEPPPEDQPQPKYAVKQQKVSAESWAGKPATFQFEIMNEGEAPLAIRLKGG